MQNRKRVSSLRNPTFRATPANAIFGECTTKVIGRQVPSILPWCISALSGRDNNSLSQRRPVVRHPSGSHQGQDRMRGYRDLTAE